MKYMHNDSNCCRHRSAYQNHSWQGLLDELNMDIKRISARNLGRDDRLDYCCITDHSSCS